MSTPFAKHMQADSSALWWQADPGRYVDPGQYQLVAWLSSGGVPDVVEYVAPVVKLPNYDALDAACIRFRAICAAIETILPAELHPFRGGFDEVAKADQYMGSAEAMAMAIKLIAANEMCNYEADKVDMQAPRWWYRCWGITP